MITLPTAEAFHIGLRCEGKNIQSARDQAGVERSLSQAIKSA